MRDGPVRLSRSALSVYPKDSLFPSSAIFLLSTSHPNLDLYQTPGLDSRPRVQHSTNAERKGPYQQHLPHTHHPLISPVRLCSACPPSLARSRLHRRLSSPSLWTLVFLFCPRSSHSLGRRHHLTTLARRDRLLLDILPCSGVLKEAARSALLSSSRPRPGRLTHMPPSSRWTSRPLP